MARYLRRITSGGAPRPERYFIYPPEVEFNGFPYLGPALVNDVPIGLCHITLTGASDALIRLRQDTTKTEWVIWDKITSTRVDPLEIT